jgi:hypothetical protein
VAKRGHVACHHVYKLKRGKCHPLAAARVTRREKGQRTDGGLASSHFIDLACGCITPAKPGRYDTKSIARQRR